MPGDMSHALSLAESICWNEGYGYRLGGHASSYADGVDCGGLVFHCLHAAGYNVADTSPGVRSMPSILSGIGFTGFQYSGNLSDLKDGDIITMVHYDSGGSVTAGHTCFIGQNRTGYTDPSANSTNTGVLSLMKIEASSSRGHTSQGDSQKNGTGAYWEVWCHAFNNVYDPDTYDPGDVYVWRDPHYTPGGDEDGMRALAGLYLLFQHVDRKKRRVF